MTKSYHPCGISQSIHKYFLLRVEVVLEAPYLNEYVAMNMENMHAPFVLNDVQTVITRLHLHPVRLQLVSTSLTVIPLVMPWITRVLDSQP